ncbi:MAG TPA: CCA tRNA nucleotidyltransferase [Candidatus Nanoarchaeia archaeon]|nr:CCA tRNA nucleotidyltransferase [Candidatus Nanoarchaeia archaeon]
MFEIILKKIKPAENEERDISTKVSKFLKILNKNLSEGKAIVGGSFAKGTWLKGQHDIDLFALFSSEEKISDKLEKAVKKSFKKYERIHGSRDYFIVDFENLSFEIIPVLKIKNATEAKNITDISPLHVKWMNNNLNEKLKDEVRIAKQFCKANKVYGAETYIKGLHGYALEILVYNYRSFMNLTKNAAKWKPNMLIHFGKNEFYSQQEFPLVLIDPVNPKRNATASLSREKFYQFVSACKQFNKTKPLKMFEGKRIDKKKYNLILEIKPLEGSNDVAGTKILKVFENIISKLNNEGFKVKSKDWEFGEKSYLYFSLKNNSISKYKKHYGPPVKFKEDLENFKKKYGKYKVENGRVYVMLKRKHTKAKDYAKELLKEKYIRERAKNIKILKS